MEIKNKLTMTREEVGWDNGGKKQKGCQGKCIKDSWARTMRGGLNVKVVWAGQGRAMGEKCGQV